MKLGLKLAFLICAMMASGLVTSSEAYGELFRRGRVRSRPIFRGPVFNRPIFRPRGRVVRGPSRVIQQPGRVVRSGGRCGNFSCVQPQRAKVNINGFDVDNFVRTEFRHLTENNGVLFEEDDRGRVIAQLFIDPRTGYLSRRFFSGSSSGYGHGRQSFFGGHFKYVGRNEPIFQELRQFYLRNRQQFVDAVKDAENKGDLANALRKLQQVDSYLAFARGRRAGRLNVNLKDAVIPDDLAKNVTLRGPGGQVIYCSNEEGEPVGGALWERCQEEAKRRSLNFVLNFLNGRNPQLINISSYADIKSLDLSSFFSDQQLDRLTSDNPYACGNESTPLRLDWLIARALDSDIYYEMNDASKTFENYARDRGLDDRADRLSRRANNVTVIGKPYESQVGNGDFRTIGWEIDKNGNSFYRSYDTKDNFVGKLINDARDPLITPPEALRFDAMEMIGRNPNGYMNFYLADKNGNRANSAPAEIAAAEGFDPFTRDHGGEGIQAPGSCLFCHAGGQLGMVDDEKYKFSITRATSFGSQLYVPNSAYQQRAIADNVKWIDTLQKSGALIYTDARPQSADRPEGRSKPAVVIPKVSREYFQGLTEAQAAQELGVSIARVRQIIPATNYVTPSEGPRTDERVIPRQLFSKLYCNYVGKAGTQQSFANPNPQGVDRLRGGTFRPGRQHAY